MFVNSCLHAPRTESVGRTTALPRCHTAQFFRGTKLKENGAQGRDRTTDTRIFSPLLYQLSYLGNATREPRQALVLYVIASALSRCASAMETGDWGGVKLGHTSVTKEAQLASIIVTPSNGNIGRRSI